MMGGSWREMSSELRKDEFYEGNVGFIVDFIAEQRVRKANDRNSITPATWF